MTSTPNPGGRRVAQPEAPAPAPASSAAPRTGATLSLVPQAVNLALYAGDGATLRVTVKDAAGAVLPIDGVVSAQIRKARNDAAPLETFAVDLSLATSGVALLSLTGDQTTALLNGTGADFAGVYDVEWHPAGGEPLTLIQGEVTCTNDVTRP